MTPLSTSKRLGGIGGESHEVNRCRGIGGGSHEVNRHAGLKNFCAGMNLPPPHAPMKNAEEIVQGAAKRLREKIAKEQLDNIEDEKDVEIAEVAVTVDGTWQKRGHTSKIGVVFVISVNIGEILDYEVKSLFCHECKTDAKDEGTDKHKEWLKEHEPNCSIKIIKALLKRWKLWLLLICSAEVTRQSN